MLAVIYVLLHKSVSHPSPYARITAASIDITNIQNGLITFRLDNGYYPGGTNGLLALVQKPYGATNWHGPYFDPPTIPQDPWGNPFLYSFPGKHNPASYVLWSAGPDEKSETDDDIGNWTTK